MLYPNPTTEQVTLDFDQQQEQIQIQLYDATDRLIKEQKYNNRQQLQLSLPEVSGLYRLYLKTENGETVFPEIRE